KEAKLKDMIVTARTATLRSYGLLNVPSDLAAMTNESFDNYIERERTAKAEEEKQAHIARAVADLKIAGYREANDGSLYLEGNDSGPYTVFPASLYPVDQ